MFEDTDESVLGDLLGLMAIARDQAHRAVEVGLLALEELLEGGVLNPRIGTYLHDFGPFAHRRVNVRAALTAYTGAIILQVATQATWVPTAHAPNARSIRRVKTRSPGIARTVLLSDTDCRCAMPPWG